MWQMLLNSLPFGKGQWGEVMERIETEELDFRKLRGKVSDSCLDLLERLLQKDPRRRISWEEFFVHPWLDLPREFVFFLFFVFCFLFFVFCFLFFFSYHFISFPFSSLPYIHINL